MLMLAVAFLIAISHNGATILGEGHLVSEGNFTLDIFYRSWKDYQNTLKQAIAPLTPEQLALRAAPGLRSVGEIVAHRVARGREPASGLLWGTLLAHRDSAGVCRPSQC